MKKILTALLSVAFLVGGCSDDDDDVMSLPEIPETDINISVPEKDKGWHSGMDFAAYPGMPEKAKGEEINVLVIDADEHARHICNVLKNESWPYVIDKEDKENLKQCFFPTHPDIKINVTESYDDFNPNKVPCDIVNSSFSVFHMSSARKNIEKYEDKEKFPKFPLVITSAGNGRNMFTVKAWKLCQALGGLSWEDHILPHYGWDPEGEFTDEQLELYKPGDVGAAYAVIDPDNLGHKKDWIIVGRADGHGNKPGPLLKDRWISTYYSFNIFDAKIDGTSYSTPYVVKIAAEIKRRAPHYTNDEIAQLIFSTADDLGSPGCDDIYGWGKLNPVKIWEELNRRGY